MKTTLIIALLQICCPFSIQSQSELPISFIIIDENLFSKSDLEQNKIQKVTCVVMTTNLEQLMAPDTLETYEFLFNDRHSPISIWHTDFANKKTDTCLFYYIGESTYSKTCRWTGKIDKKFAHCDNTEYTYKYLYEDNQLTSLKELLYCVKTKQVIAETIDTFLYNNNLLIKNISYWRRSPNLMQVDSIIKIYMYDSLKNLIEYSITPSATFNIRFPPDLYDTYSMKSKNVYKYMNDTVLINKYYYYDYLPKNTYSLSEEISINRKFGSDCLVNRTLDEPFDLYKVSLYDKTSNRYLEYKYNEIKTINYIDNTRLPKLIIIIDNYSILYYCFHYSIAK